MLSYIAPPCANRVHSFVKMVAVAKTGGQLIAYSDRFSYSGMTGTFPANVQSALSAISGTKGPATVDNTVASNPKADPAAPADSMYEVEYTMQTGPTRYAPMQPVPPKTITAKNTKPLYPKSSVVIATTKLPIPSIQTTLTQSQTYSVSSMVNTVCEPKQFSLPFFPNEIISFICSEMTNLPRLHLLPIQPTIWPSSSTDGRIKIHEFLEMLILYASERGFPTTQIVSASNEITGYVVVERDSKGLEEFCLSNFSYCSPLISRRTTLKELYHPGT